MSPRPWRSRNVAASAWCCWTSSGPAVPFGWVAGDDEFDGLRFPGRPCATRGSVLRFGRAVQHVDPGPGRDAGPRTSAAAVAAGGPVGQSLNPHPALASPGGRRRGQGSEGGAGVGDVGAGQGRERRVGPVELLVVIRTVAEESQVARTRYPMRQPTGKAAGRGAGPHGRRHGIEEMLQAGKGDVGS